MTSYVLWSSLQWFLPLVGGMLVFLTTKAGYRYVSTKELRSHATELSERQQHHAHVNAMERALDIPESVWDDEDIAEPKPKPAPQAAASTSLGAYVSRRDEYRAPIPPSPPGYSASCSVGYYPESTMGYSASCVSEMRPTAGRFLSFFMWQDRVRSYGGQITSHSPEIYSNSGWSQDTIEISIYFDPKQAYDAMAELNQQASSFGILPRFTYGGQEYFSGGLQEMRRVHEDYWRMQHLNDLYARGGISREAFRTHLDMSPPPPPRRDPGRKEWH